MVALPHHAHGARFVGVGRTKEPFPGLRVVLGYAVSVVIRNPKITERGVMILRRSLSPKPARLGRVDLAEIAVHMADAKVIKPLGVPETG